MTATDQATLTRQPTARPMANTAGPGTGTGTLVRFMLRRDRFKLPAWVAGLGLFVVYIGVALPRVAPTEDDLAALVPLLEQPVGRMFTGPAYGVDALTYEVMFASGYSLYLFVIAALMNITLVVRHTRAEEQTGRAELVRASVTGRHAVLTAVLIVAVLTNAVAAVVVTGMATANGFAFTGSALVGCGVGLVGMAFAAVSAVTVQLSEYSRAAAGLAGSVLGVAFVARALGDMAAVGGSPASWTSPLGWASQTAPYVRDRWWPLLLPATLAAVGVVIAFVLQSRRDLGAGLIAARAGRSEAPARLGTPVGLAARLQRSALLSWGVAILLLGIVDGAFTQAMLDAGQDMPPAIRDVFGGESLASGYLAFLAVLTAYVTAAYVVFAVQCLRTEESRGRAETVLATPIGRPAWMGAHLLVIAIGAALILLVSGVATGAAAAAVTGDWSRVAEVTLAHLNLVPAVLFVLGLCALLFGWAPRLLAPVGYALVALMVFVGNFAGLLDLPDWFLDLSPLSHPAQLPVEDFTVLPPVVLAGLALVTAALGLAGLSRREIGSAH